MATYRRIGKKKHWRVEVSKNGVRKSKVFEFKSDANEWARKQEDMILTGYTVKDALERYFEEVSPKHKSYRWEKYNLINLAKQLPEKRLCDLTSNDICVYRDTQMARVGPNSVRRRMTLLNSVLTIALHEWGWIKTSPARGVKIPSLPPARRRGVPDEAIKAILPELLYSPTEIAVEKCAQVAVGFLFGIETAMRRAEIFELENKDINYETRIATLWDTKNKDDRKVPLSSKAIKLLKQLHKREGSDEPNYRLFDVNIDTATTYFIKARNRAGFPDTNFHDSRSEGLTRLSSIFSIIELTRIVGHRSPASLMYYYAPSIEELAKKLD